MVFTGLLNNLTSMDGNHTSVTECPWNSNTSCPSGYVNFNTGSIPSYIAIVSCIFSCLGSILIIITYFVLKDMQTGSQKIITLLAFADFISAVGYIVGSSNYIHHYNRNSTQSCETFQKLCTAQAAVTTWSSLVSFCWTAILAIYFVLIIIFKRVRVASKLMVFFNVIAWCGPLLIVIPLLAFNKLGYAHFAASNWCFVKTDPNRNIPLSDDWQTIMITMVAGKFWEILSYIVVTILYVIIMVAMGEARRKVRNTVMEPRVIHVETRLLAIPIIFILLRIWGTFQFFFSIATSKTTVQGSGGDHQCIHEAIFKSFQALGILQAIGDGGQGWGNAILYIFLSPIIRERLINVWFGKCAMKLEDHLNRVGDHPTDQGVQRINTGENRISKNGSIDESAPLLPDQKAAGYNIRQYDTTTSYTGGFLTGTDISITQ